MSLILNCIRRYRWALAVSVLCMSVSLICDLMIPWLLQILIDDGVTPGNAAVIEHTGLAMLAIITLSLAASIVAYRLSANAAAQIGRYLRETLYHHILSLPYESFNTISASTLITRLSNDVLQIQNMFLMVQRVAIGLPISFVMGLVLSIQLSPDLSLTYIVTVPLLCAFFRALFSKDPGSHRPHQPPRPGNAHRHADDPRCQRCQRDHRAFSLLERSPA